MPHPKDYTISAWTGNFGDEYVDRNDYAPWKMQYGVEGFSRILKDIKINSVLEVGSNIGQNLLFINKIIDYDVKFYSVEPNKKAYNKFIDLKEHIILENIYNVDVLNMPLKT